MSRKLKEALKSLSGDELLTLAAECATDVEYLTEQVANGHRNASAGLAQRLVKHALLAGKVTLHDLRPDIYPQELAA